MAGVQHIDHHHPACVLYGVQDCGPLYLCFRMGSEHRTCDAGTVHEVGCAGVKGPEACGRVTDMFEGPAEALC